MANSTLSKCEDSTSCSSLFGLIEIFIIGFFRWVSFALFRVWPLIRHLQSVSEKKSKDLEFKSLIKHDINDADDDDGGISRDDVEMVMRSLGLFTDPESEGLQNRYSSEELSNLFEEKEPSLEELKQAFDIFDENRDGLIDPIDLQRVLTIIGLKEEANLENCRRVIRSFGGDKDGRMAFHGFVKLMENKLLLIS